MTRTVTRNKFGISEVIQRFGKQAFHSGKLTPRQIEVLRMISLCKTAALGGHWEQCDKCAFIKKHYNSCGDRHCPNCQGVNKERWILDRSFDLLPVKYFHCVFTIPSELRTVVAMNKKLCFDLLFTAVKETLLDFGYDKRQKMEGKVGGISVLHTWNQKLEFHPHIHCIVPAGGLTSAGIWKNSKGKANFLFHVKAMSALFKNKFLIGLKFLLSNGQLTLPHHLKPSVVPSAVSCLVNHLFDLKWNVYAKEAFAGPQQVLEYLARYTHKICIANYRIIKVTDTHVTFSFLDRKINKKRLRKVTGLEFIHLFAQHILPKQFCKIRHFGFLCSRTKKRDLAAIRNQLRVTKPMKPSIRLTAKQVMMATSGQDPYLCPCCKNGQMVVIKIIPVIRGSPVLGGKHLIPRFRVFAKDKPVRLV